MSNSILPDSSYWNLYDHVDKINSIVQRIAEMPTANAALFAFLFLMAFLFVLAKLLKLFNLKDNTKKWILGAVVIVYVVLIYCVKVESNKMLEHNLLKQRVLNEMVYNLWSACPAPPLCMSLEIELPQLKNLAVMDPSYFHYSIDVTSIPQFRIENNKILAAIEEKKKDLEEAITSTEEISYEAIKMLATNTKFGKVSDELLGEIVAKRPEYNIVKSGPSYVISKRAFGAIQPVAVEILPNIDPN